MAASSRDPRETDDRRFEASSVLLSAKPASSAYSKALIQTLFGASPTVIPASGVS